MMIGWRLSSQAMHGSGNPRGGLPSHSCCKQQPTVELLTWHFSRPFTIRRFLCSTSRLPFREGVHLPACRTSCSATWQSSIASLSCLPAHVWKDHRLRLTPQPIFPCSFLLRHPPEHCPSCSVTDPSPPSPRSACIHTPQLLQLRVQTSSLSPASPLPLHPPLLPILPRQSDRGWQPPQRSPPFVSSAQR